jgi:hypothetical protein
LPNQQPRSRDQKPRVVEIVPLKLKRVLQKLKRTMKRMGLGRAKRGLPILRSEGCYPGPATAGYLPRTSAGIKLEVETAPEAPTKRALTTCGQKSNLHEVSRGAPDR